VFYHHSAGCEQSFEFIRNAFLIDENLPFANVLNEEEVAEALAQDEADDDDDDDDDAAFGGSDNHIYTPALTLWAFLSQVMHAGAQRSCNAAVERLRSLCLAIGIRPPSADSGAYCRARARLSGDGIKGLVYQLSDALEEQVPVDWLWHGRHVKIADGSTLTAPDTPENQEAWPQMSSQKPGLGFPIIRFCVLMSLATFPGSSSPPDLGRYGGLTQWLGAPAL
jgi:hypothetical protein